MEPEGLLPCSQEPSIGPILSQINPVHTTPSCLSKIHFNVTHPRTSWSERNDIQGKIICDCAIRCLCILRLTLQIINCPSALNYHQGQWGGLFVLLAYFKIFVYFIFIIFTHFLGKICPIPVLTVHSDIPYNCTELLRGFSPPANYTNRAIDRRLSAKLVPTLADRGCRVVSATNPHGH
jgi:hypothetical protein